MVKPKFTPDPPPNIDGLPVEQQVRMLFEHYQRQYNRIEDWWPKDFENRIQALEGLVPYKIGPWVMVSVSSMDWDYEPFTVLQACSPTAPTFDAAYDYSTEHTLGGMWAFDFNSDGTKLYASIPANGGLGQGIAHYTLSTALDVSTASYVGHVSRGGGNPGGASFPFGMRISEDESKMYILDADFNASGKAGIFEYVMSTPGDLTTIADPSPVTTANYIDIEATIANPIGLEITKDGKHVYVGVNASGDGRLYKWDMSTPGDLTTASFDTSIDLHALSGFPAVTTYWTAIHIDDAGDNLVVGGPLSSQIHVLSLSTKYDATSASYTRSFTVTNTTGIYDLRVSLDCASISISSPNQNEFQRFLT